MSVFTRLGFSNLPPKKSPDLGQYTEATQILVRVRDGATCWLCGCSARAVACLIEANLTSGFTPLQRMGLVPEDVTHPEHHDNLILLCKACRKEFDSDPPLWLLVPEEEVLRKWIQFEETDYCEREAAARKGETLPRGLPNTSGALCNPALLGSFAKSMGPNFFSRTFPRAFAGSGICVIHKALRGLGMPVVCGPNALNKGVFDVGLDPSTKMCLAKLANLWSRPPPTVTEQQAAETKLEQADEGVNGDGGAGGTRMSKKQSDEFFAFGPHSTSSEKAELFTRLYKNAERRRNDS